MVHAAETVAGAGRPKQHRVEVDDHPGGGGDPGSPRPANDRDVPSSGSR